MSRAVYDYARADVVELCISSLGLLSNRSLSMSKVHVYVQISLGSRNRTLLTRIWDLHHIT